VLGELKTKIKPFEELWALRNEFDEKMKAWSSDPLRTLSPDAVDGDFKKMFAMANKLQGKFEKVMPKPHQVASTMKNKLTEFRPCVNIIRSLCNPALASDNMDNTNTAGIFKLVGMN
jgi:hypothetical protein